MSEQNTGRGRQAHARGQRNTRLARRRRGEHEQHDAPAPEPAETEAQEEPRAEGGRPQEREEPREQESEEMQAEKPDEVRAEKPDEAQDEEPAEVREQGSAADGAADGGARPRMSLSKIARTAREELQLLIGRPVTAVLGVEPREGGCWEVHVETLELERIPQTTSVMGVYDVTVDGEGEILEFRRSRRYRRAQSDDGS